MLRLAKNWVKLNDRWELLSQLQGPGYRREFLSTPRGCSKRLSSKAARNGTTEAYPRGYVARRHTTENAAGGLFQQPLRLDDYVDKRRH
jgi:hypothetical protein